MIFNAIYRKTFFQQKDSGFSLNDISLYLKPKLLDSLPEGAKLLMISLVHGPLLQSREETVDINKYLLFMLI